MHPYLGDERHYSCDQISAVDVSVDSANFSLHDLSYSSLIVSVISPLSPDGSAMKSVHYVFKYPRQFVDGFVLTISRFPLARPKNPKVPESIIAC